MAVMVVAWLAAGCSSSHTQATPAGTPYRFAIEGSPPKAAVQQAVAILDDRLRPYKGVASLVGGDLVLYLPGPKVTLDRQLLAPDQLDFRPVLAGPIPPGTKSKSGVVISATPSSALRSPGAKQRAVVLPEMDAGTGKVEQYWYLGPVAVTGSALSTVSSDLNQQGQWEVRPVFRTGSRGIDLFNGLAARCFAATSPSCPPIVGNVHGQVAIVLDDVVLAAPTIDAPSFERDQITIAGSFTQRQAAAIALALRSGALPVRLVPR